MKIQIKADAVSGKVKIPRGEYIVALSSEMQSITLIGGGNYYPVPATKRRSVAKSKSLQISFYASGGRLWSLVVSAPKDGEWIATLELDEARG